jgi:hypothetical protein
MKGYFLWKKKLFCQSDGQTVQLDLIHWIHERLTNQEDEETEK